MRERYGLLQGDAEKPGAGLRLAFPTVGSILTPQGRTSAPGSIPTRRQPSYPKSITTASSPPRTTAGNSSRRSARNSSSRSTGATAGGMGSAAPSRLRVHNVGNNRALWEKGHDHAGSPLVT